MNLIVEDAELIALGAGQTAKQFFIIVLKVVGLIFLIKAIIELVEAIIYWITLGRGLGIVDPYPWNALNGAITLLISHYLFTGGEFFVKTAFKK